MRAEVITSGASATPSDQESLASAEAEDGEEEDAGSEADAASQEADAVGLPCAVKTVFVEHCQGCHGPDAKNGTPLLTRDNLLADSRKEPGTPVVQRALARVTASDKPMPPVGKGVPLSEEQLNVIQAWVEQGAPPGRCDE